MRPALAILAVLALALLAFLLLRTAPAPPPPKAKPGIVSAPSSRVPKNDSRFRFLPAPEAGERVTIRGIVFDRESLETLSGATVRHEQDGRSFTADSDGCGVWCLDVPRRRGGRDWMRVEKEGYLPSWAHRWAPGPSGWVGPVFLAPIRRRVSGRVVDLLGEPLQGVTVGMANSSSQYRTGRDGRFGPVPLGAGKARWAAWSDVHARASGEYADGPLRIVLEPAVFTEGLVVDGAGRPLEGVEVFGRGGDDELVLLTGEDGRFRWPLAPADLEALEVRKEGYLCDNGGYEVFAGGRARFVMRRSTRVRGCVVSASGGPPPPGLYVQGNRGLDWLDADGSFDLPRVHPVHTQLRVGLPLEPDRHWPSLTLLRRSVDPTPGGTTEGLELRLPMLRRLRVVVRDVVTGRPVPGASFLGGVTDESGIAEVLAPVSGDWPRWGVRAVVTAPGHVLKRVKMRPSDVLVEVELVPAVPVLLRAVDEAGRPAGGADVSFRRDGKERPLVWCEQAGPGGRARLLLPRNGRGLLTVSRRHIGRAESRIEVGDGQDLGDIVLRPARPRAPSGPERVILVLDEAGNRLPDAWFAFILDGREEPDATGSELLIRCSERTRTGWVGAPGREFREVDLTRDATTVRLRPAMPVRGRLLDAAGRPLRGRGVEVSGRPGFTFVDDHGAFRIEGVPTGERVRIEAETWSHPRIRVDGIAGGPEVEIRLPPRGTIRIRLRGGEPGGEPEFEIFESSRLEEAFMSGRSGAFVRRVGDSLLVDCPEGTWPVQVRCRPGGHVFWPDVEVKAGRETTLVYRFPVAGRVRGRVFGLEGEPVGGARITVEMTGAELGQVEEDGTFDIEVHDSVAIPVVPARLRFQGWHHAPVVTEPVDLREETELEVRFAGRGGRIRGSLADRGGKPLEGRVCILTDRGIVIAETYAEKDSGFEIERPLAPGRARLEASVEGRDPVETLVEVREGETTEAEIVVR